MLILYDVRFLSCLTCGHTYCSLKLVAFLPHGQRFTRPRALVPGTACAAADRCGARGHRVWAC